jgi:hypothetical protein
MIKDQDIPIKQNIIKGNEINNSLYILDNNKNLLLNNFNPSNNGCKIPNNLTLLTPTRIWLNPKTLRSNKVINAIDNKILTTQKITVRMNKIILINPFSTSYLKSEQ